LRREEPVAVYYELISPSFASEDPMVFEHQTASLGPGMLSKKQGRRETAQAATHYDAIENLAGVDPLGWGLVVKAVPELVSGVEDRPRIAVGVAVIADASRAVPLGRGVRFCAQANR
jgi:hypothetical protein